MGLDKTKTLEDFKDIPEGVEQLFRDREIKNDNSEFEKSRGLLFWAGIGLSVFVLILLYFVSGASRVRALAIGGNQYLDTRYIEGLSGITLDSRYYLTFPHSVRKKIEADPFVEKADIRMNDGNMIQIIVHEKRPLGYRYDDDIAYILMDDDTKAELKPEYMQVISRIPYIDGFYEDEQTHLLTVALKNIDQKVIEEIAEIHQYALKYDDEAIQLQMRDGTYVFTSYFQTSALDQYHKMYSLVANRNNCLYTVEGSRQDGGSMVSARECPWDEVPIEHDYWMDHEGNYILNKFGDRAVKHYYQDANGFYFLDDSGNYIVIPINEKGEDVRDPDFELNYLAGYYATGQLVIPQEEEVPAEEAGEEQPEEGNTEEQQTEEGNTGEQAGENGEDG